MNAPLLLALRLATTLALAGVVGAAGAARAADPAPSPAAATTAARGEGLFHTVCEKCHGIYGRGDGPALQYMTVKPPDLTEPAVFAGRTDEQIVTGLQERAKNPETAHSPMVLAGVVKEQDLLAAVHYARTLGVPGQHASLASGRDIYTSICWTCHGLDGRGTGPSAANLPGAKPRDFTSPDFKLAGREEEVYTTISEGAAKAFHGSQYMLSWKGALTPQQIRDVMAYIATFQKPGK